MGLSNISFLWTAIFPMIVLLYYFFRKKYSNQPVSSTIFWREVMQETRVSPYLKHLQKNSLLYLQLLALLLFVLALMQPYLKTSKIAGAQVIWIVDTSATLLAGKEGESTFDQHRKEMKELVSELDERPLTIITTGNTPEAIVRQETNKAAIRQAIEELDVTYEEEQLSKAVDVAQAFVGNESTSIYVFTDALDQQQLPIENNHVKWIVRGASTNLENVAITKLAATTDGPETMAMIQLKNDTEVEQNLQLMLMDDEGKVVIQEKVSLEPLASATKLYKELPTMTSLTAKIDLKDDYLEDNKAITLLQQGASQMIMDQSMHQLIQKGFTAIGADVKLMQADSLSTEDMDTVIVTNQSKLLEVAKGPVFLIGRDDVDPIEVNQKVDVSKDALFAFDTLEDVYVREVYPGFEGYTTIATIGEQPFIQRSPKGDIVVLADLQATDWPLHPSFPLFLWSVQNELATGTSNLGVFMPNESRSIALPSDDWSIYSTDDHYIASIEDGRQFRAPTKPGIYTIRSNEEQKEFIVQLANQERHITKGTSFELGQVEDADKVQTANKSLIRWIIFIVLVMIVIEWEVQRRRGFTN